MTAHLPLRVQVVTVGDVRLIPPLDLSPKCQVPSPRGGPSRRRWRRAAAKARRKREDRECRG
jgi:hypothetical protein